MSLKALDELRELIGQSRNEYIQGNVSYNVGFNDIADRIEAELSERYMKLPVDADGVPIHVGDTLEHVPGGWAFTADMLEIDRWGNHARMNGQSRIPCECCRHVKPRTIEDVLLDAGVSRACVEDVAAELRELMGGAE